MSARDKAPQPIIIPDDQWESVKSRFWSKVSVVGLDECWPWSAGRFADEYGAFYVHPRTVKAHRVAFLLHNGSLETELLVCHTCDNHPCCNPKHLFQGTEGDNQRDMRHKRRGFSMPGESHPLSKLTAQDVHAIRMDIRTHKVIGLDYNISQPVITRIKKGKRWASV